jgi:acyl-CoA synthetase (AMP-forming)/AMP-acid ligase II
VLLGRDSKVINIGGEKVIVEEVETAIKHHPNVVDALVLGRRNECWGTEVVAVLEVSIPVDSETPKEFCRDRLARCGVPEVFLVARIRRPPAGKGDYKWAAQIVLPSHTSE